MLACTSWRTVVSAFCLLQLLQSALSVSGHAVHRQNGKVVAGRDLQGDRKEPKKAWDVESIFAGFAKSMIGRTGSSSSQLLSLNLSNVVLMLVLKGLIWGASYMQLGGGGDGKGRREGLLQDAITETDLMLFLGYLVADESGRYDCLSRVACEQPSRAEGYLKSAELVWNAAKVLDGVVPPLDAKYEDMLDRLQEAIEDGRANGDCRAKYRCSDSANAEDKFNLV